MDMCNLFNIVAGTCSILGFLFGLKMKNKNTKLQDNNIKNCTEQGIEKTMNNKKLKQKVYSIINKYHGSNLDIYYDDGIFHVGWDWFIGNVTIMKIERHGLNYKYAVWVNKGVNNGKEYFGYNELKKLTLDNLKNDEELNNRIEWAKDKH